MPGEVGTGKKFRKSSVDMTEAGREGMSTEAAEVPERWSSGKKAEVVLRLLRGEPDAERELTRARAKVGELMMERKLTDGLLKKGAFGDDLKKLGR